MLPTIQEVMGPSEIVIPTIEYMERNYDFVARRNGFDYNRGISLFQRKT